ncbi:MAG: hypothetical protein ACI9OJ_001347 [Myxococcota bacterium]|jgi:hypothetical protein
MIERIVLVKLKDEFATVAGRTEFAEESRRILPTIPGVISADAGIPADAAAAASWDISLLIRFNAIEDVPAYIVDPIHKHYVETILSPRAECKKAWNFSRP